MTRASKTEKVLKWFIIGMVAAMIALLVMPAFADVYRKPYRDIDINSHNTRTVNRDDSVSTDVKISTGDVNVSGTTTQELNNTNQNIANSQTTVNVEGDVIPADTTHYETQNIKLENTPDNVTITPGSGDSCKAYIGGNISVPGLGTGINIPLPGKECRKLKYYDRLMDIGRYEAAAKLFCDLREVIATFGRDEAVCEAAVLYVKPEPVSTVSEPVTDILMADITQEEYEEQHELVETRYSQQQNKIASQEQELTALKAKVAKALEERDKRDEERAKSEAYFKAVIAAKAAKDE